MTKIQHSITSTITCKGGPDLYFEEVKDSKPGDPFYPMKSGYLCDQCLQYDSTQYEFEIVTQVNNLPLTSYAYACTECHKKNCSVCSGSVINDGIYQK